MNLGAAQSLTAWLWNAHPELVDMLLAQVPRQLGQCISCDIDLFSSGTTCDGDFTSLSDPTLSIDSSGLTCITCSPFKTASCGLDSIGTDTSVCIPTLDESDLTPVSTDEVTGTCDLTNINYGCQASCSSSIKGSNAGTSSALSNVANFLTSSAGLSALAKVAASYFAAQAASSNAKTAASQAAVLASQTARAVTGKTALPVTYVANANGTTSAMVSTTAGLLPLTSSTLASLTPSSVEVFLAQYGSWILVGGASLFLLYAASKRRPST
jgi:hypothetical protein